MTASLVPNAKQQFIDINGDPLVGGLVYMYTVATLIFKDTWTTAEQTVLNSNPIMLDSRGQAVIYGTGSYRQILTDSLGNLIWDKNIEAFQSSVFGTQVSLASNTTTDLGSASSNNVLITGTTTITSFGNSASLGSPLYYIQFSGILTLTYNATSLFIPGAMNIVTAVGDAALVEFTNVLGYWKIVAYWPVAAGPVVGTAAAQNTGTSGATVGLLNGNNTYSGSAQFTKQTWGPEAALTVATNASTPDFSASNNFAVSISANYTLNNPINIQAGQSGVFCITQTNSTLTIAWGGNYKAAGGIANVGLSGVNGATDFFAYYAHSSTFIVITSILHPT